LWMQVEMEHDPCQHVVLLWGKSLATKEPWVCRLHWDDVTCPRRLHTEHRELFLVSSYCFYEPILFFHHSGEVHHRHAAEMTAVCNSWWNLAVKPLPVMRRKCFCREAREKVRLGMWTVTAERKTHCLLLLTQSPGSSKVTFCRSQAQAKGAGE